jgi:hypothetical protein
VYAGGRGNGSYVDCHDNSAFYGYSISTDSCGFFGGYDPANYNLGQYLQGTTTSIRSFVSLFVTARLTIFNFITTATVTSATTGTKMPRTTQTRRRIYWGIALIVFLMLVLELGRLGSTGFH